MSRFPYCEPRGLRTSLFLQWLKEYLSFLCRGRCPMLSTKRERNADVETIITAMLDSCCCQNASQTISTTPPASLTPAILTIETTTMANERHIQSPRPAFWCALIRIWVKIAIGNERTMKSVKTSTLVATEVSRITR